MTNRSIQESNIEESTLAKFGASGPRITTIQYANASMAVTQTNTANVGDPFYVIINGTGFQMSSLVIVGKIQANYTTFISPTQVFAQIPALTLGKHTVYVQNGDGTTAIKVDGLDYGVAPVPNFGSLILRDKIVNYPFSDRFTAITLGDLTWSLANTAPYSGTLLPANTALASNGYFYGVPNTIGTNYFYINATSAGQSATSLIQATINTGDSDYYRTGMHVVSREGPGFSDDFSEYSHTFKTFGDTRPSSFHPLGQNWSYLFLGTVANYITLPINDAYNALGTLNWTIEGWFFTGSTALQNLVYLGGSASTFAAIRIDKTATNTIQVLCSLNGTSHAINFSSAAITIGIWNHIALCRSGTSVYLWINGVQGGATTTLTGSLFAGTVNRIGILGNATQPYSGLISNLRLVKGTALYTAAFTPPITKLTNITNTALLIAQDPYLVDNSDNNITISVVGEIPIRPTSPYGNNLSEPIINPETAISYFFDTGSNYLSNATIGVTNFLSSDFTVEYWIYPLLKTTGAAFYNHVGTPSSAAGIGFGQYNRTFGATTSTVGYTSTVGVDFDAWQHIAWVRSSNTLKLYKNGILGYSVTLTTNLTVTGIGIGATKTGANAMLPGYIADIRVNKFEPIYTSNFTPPAAPADTTQFLTVNGLTTFTDISNNAFAITAAGDVYADQFIPYGTNWSAYFDGTGDYLAIPDNITLRLTGDFTVEFFIYATILGSQRRLIVKGNNAANDYSIDVNAGGSFTFNNSSALGTSNRSIVINSWNHIALTRVGTLCTWWINGISSGTFTTSQSFDNTNALWIGQNQTTGLNFFGYLSNLRIIKGTALYTTAFTPPTAPLTAIANTSLLTLQDNKFVDKSTNEFAITRFGDAAIKSFGPFTSYSTAGWSGYFDGTGDYLTVPDNAAFEMTGDFTVEAWFYMTATPGTFGDIITKGAAGIFQPYYIFVNSSNALLFYSSSNGTTWDVASAVSFGTVTRNTWYHVAVSRQGTAMRLFLNGSLITTITNGTALFDNTRAVAIGARSDGTETFTGYISDVRIVKGTAVYTEAFTPPTTPLTAIEGTALLTLYNTVSSTQTLLNIGNDKNFTRTGTIGTYNFGPYGNYKPVDTTKSSYAFDGTGDYISLDDTAVWDFAGDFTFEAWVYPTLVSGSRNIISQWVTSGWCFVFRIENGFIAMYVYNGTTTGYVGTTAFITNYKWQHVAATRHNGTIRLFVNGVLDATSGAAAGAIAGFSRPLIGVESTGTSLQAFYGYISNLRVLNGTALYTTSFKPSRLPLTAIANTVLLTAQDSSYIDRSNSNSSFVVVGNTAIQSFSPYLEPDDTFSYDSSRVGSTYFDGTGDYILADPGNSDAFNLPGDFTWECWVYYTGTFAAASVIYDTLALSDATGTGRFKIAIETTGRVTGNTNVSTSFYSSATGVIVKNAWTHILIARSGTTITGYINGTQSGPTVTNSTNFLTKPNRPAIGSAGGTIGTHMFGYLYNLRVLKGRALWTANTSVPTNPLSYNDANTALLLLSTYDSENNRKIVDKSRNAVLPTVVGNPTIGSFNPYGPTEYSLNFLNSYINLAAPAALVFGSSNFTIEMRVYFITIAADAMFYDARPASTNGVYPSVGYVAASKKFRYYVNSADRILSDVIVESNRWYHLVLSRSGGVTRMFVDGVEQSSTYTDANVYLNGASRPIIGVDGFNVGAGNFRGYMYDLRVLVGTGVTSVTVPTEPLGKIANTQLLMCKTNRIFDYSNANYALTVTGTGAKVIPFSPYKSSAVYQPDIHGASIYLDGSDYITMPYYKELYDWWLSDYTIECWVNLTAFSSDVGGQIIGCMNPSTATKYWNLGISNTGSVVFYYFTTAGVLLNSGKVVKLKEWNHIAVTHKLGSGIRIWVNGQAGPVTAVSGTPTAIVSQTLSIGGYNNIFMNGYISNLRLTKEVMYSGNTAAPTSPAKLTANTILMMNFDTGAIIDYTTRHNIVTVGDARVLHAPTRANTDWNDYRNRYTNTAIYFDGTGDYLTIPATLSETEILATGDWCIEFWVNREVSGVQHTIYDQRSATTQVVPHIYISTGNSIVYYVNGADRIVSNTITSNTWYNVVIERYSGNTSMYLNGTRTGGIYADTNVYVLNNNLIGAAASVGTPFRGYLQDFRITQTSRYGANLTSQITQSYPLGY